MNVGGSLTPDGRFTGTLAVPKEEQADWLKVLQSGQPDGSPLKRIKRLVLHSGEIEAEVAGIPLLGTVTADVKILVDEGG